jgi:uncharacterized protein (TIGR02246 family)
MLRNTLFIALVALLLLLTVSCTTTPAPPPPDTRAADVQTVKDLETAWGKDMAAKDADKWASYYSEDAIGLFPGMGILNGKANIKAALPPFLGDPNFALTLQSTKIVASKGGDMVYSVGNYTMTLTNPKTKKPVTDKGKYLTVYMKQTDGSWKAVADTYNSDSAM